VPPDFGYRVVVDLQIERLDLVWFSAYLGCILNRIQKMYLRRIGFLDDHYFDS
jgi:hypothetical protein